MSSQNSNSIGSLIPGSESPLVKVLQSYLKTLGCYPVERGLSENFDQVTCEAIKKFKQQEGLLKKVPEEVPSAEVDKLKKQREGPSALTDDSSNECLVDAELWRKLIEKTETVFPPIGALQLTAITTLAATQAVKSGLEEIKSDIRKEVAKVVKEALTKDSIATTNNNTDKLSEIPVSDPPTEDEGEAPSGSHSSPTDPNENKTESLDKPDSTVKDRRNIYTFMGLSP